MGKDSATPPTAKKRKKPTAASRKKAAMKTMNRKDRNTTTLFGVGMTAAALGAHTTKRGGSIKVGNTAIPRAIRSRVRKALRGKKK